MPLYLHRQLRRPYVSQTVALLASGATPFDVAGPWELGHDISRLDDTTISTWRQFRDMCASYNHAPIPITVTALIAYMLYYVLVRGNSSASLNGQLSRLHTFASAQIPALLWPDFAAHGSGASMTARITKVQKDWPAEVQGAPALTLRQGLTRAISYLQHLPETLWTLQWIAIYSLMHAMLLRPSEIIPLDAFPVAAGTTSAFMYPRRGEFLFIEADPLSDFLGGLLYVIALSKTMKACFDARLCTALAIELGSATVNAPRALRTYLLAAGLFNAPADTPIFYYRHRSGYPRPHMDRASILREFREHILLPAGVANGNTYTLRSLRPGGTTDLAAAGVDDKVIRKIGKWTSVAGFTPYNRVDHHMLQGLSQKRTALLSLQ